MAKTSTHLANEALDKLGLVGLGQSPAAEDTERVLDMYESFKSFIEGINVYSITDDDDIDLAAFNWLAEYLAYFVASKFQKPTDDARRQAAEYHLKRVQASQPTYETLRSEYY